MTSARSAQEIKTACSRCGVEVERCAVCEKQRCDALICYRCARTELGQSLEHPHVHGG